FYSSRRGHTRLVSEWSSDVCSSDLRYVAVMIPNTGADAMAWWWYTGVTGSQVGSLLQQNGAFLISIQPADSSGSTFNVVMQQSQNGKASGRGRGEVPTAVCTM